MAPLQVDPVAYLKFHHPVGRCPYLACFLAQSLHACRDGLDTIKHVVEGAGQVQCHDFEALAGVFDAVWPRVGLTLGIDEQSARQVEGGRVDQELVQVRARNRSVVGQVSCTWRRPRRCRCRRPTTRGRA